MSDKSIEILLSLLVVIVFLTFIGIIGKCIYNEINFNKWRKNLKVGDETNRGVVTKIEGDIISCEHKVDISIIYPKDRSGTLYKYKE